MAKQTNLFLTKGIVTKGLKILPADGTTLLTLYTASADDAILKSLIFTSLDTATKVVRVYVTTDGVDVLVGAVSIPTLSGTNGTAIGIDFFGTGLNVGFVFENAGKPAIALQAGDIVKVGATTAVTAATEISVFAIIEEY